MLSFPLLHCNEPTMEVVEHEPDDSYEARMYGLRLPQPRRDFA
jgi:hypothetical protein